MADELDATRIPGKPSEARRMVLAGRIKKREKNAVQIELVDGLTVDVMNDDYTIIEETTDPVTLRPTITLELKGQKPITATFQPHLYRVLASAPTKPFVFGGGSRGGVVAMGVMAAVNTGGGSTPDHDTRMMSRTWIGTTQEDGTKGDLPSEPDEIVLN
jgi:hypothetical protein